MHSPKNYITDYSLHVLRFVFFPEHSQKLAGFSLPLFIILELSISIFVSRHLGFLVIIEGPLLGVAHVPGVAQDPGRDIVLGDDVKDELVVLEEALREDQHPPEVPGVQRGGGGEVVAAVQQGLDHGLRGRELGH